MRSVRVALALLVALAPAAAARRARTVVRFAPPPPVRSVLWVAAHPDDELLAAPALAFFCRESGARCAFLVATRGERGACELPSCGPDLGAIREQELRASATVFHASAIVGSFPDGSSWSPDAVLATWNASSPSLSAFVGAALDEVRPDLVLTLDPRHGSTCHPDHRAIGRAALLAAADRGVRAGVLLTRARPVGEWDSVVMDPNLGRADFAVDGGRGSRWNALLEVARAHASQFSAKALAALEAVPPERRLVGFEILEAVPAGDDCGG